jgi:serine/threonine protein phosphatase PrpC
MNGNTGCWVLADGLGGHHGGATASRVAVDSMLASFKEDSTVSPEALTAHIDRANQAILERQQSDPELQSMRTTVVALLASPETAVWAHVGDSRLYRFYGKTCERTKDHSVPQRLADAGEIREDQIRFHEDRNRLLRSLGSRAEAGVEIGQAQHRATLPGEAFLLASDGFWEWLADAEMVQDLRASWRTKSWLKKMEKRIQKRATPHHDNYSAIAVRVGSMGSTSLWM